MINLIFILILVVGSWNLGLYEKQLICSILQIASQTGLDSDKLETCTVGLFVSYHVLSSITCDILVCDI